MDRAELKALLTELGISAGKYGYFKDSGDNIQFCCPFHSETRPSCGINIYTLVGQCFACEESFNLAKLVAHCLDFTLPSGRYDYNRAYNWLEEKYNVKKRSVNYNPKSPLRRIEDEEDLEEQEDKPKRHEISKLKLAVYKSGKVIHKYFLDRGFTKETARKFMIGWDNKRKRITIPVFWEDGALCGIIGRAVLEMKIDGKPNPEFYKVYKKSELNDVKYYIYDKFPVGDILYPLPHFKLIDDTVILVEGALDAIWLHQLGFPNTLATLGSKLSFNKREQRSKQVDILHNLGVRKVILLRDLDTAGIKGAEHDYKILKQEGFLVYKSEYPEGKSDPQELTYKELYSILNNKHLYILNNALKRIND